jgi:hypothetical protein
MTRGRLALAILLAVVAIGAFFGARSMFRNSEASATATADRFLAAACGGADDRGWGLLVADQREAAFGSRDGYLARVADTDCAGFAWRIGAASCDDAVCIVWLSVRDKSSIPGFIVDAEIVSSDTDKAPAGVNAGMAVLQRWPFGGGVMVPDG